VYPFALKISNNEMCGIKYAGIGRSAYLIMPSLPKNKNTQTQDVEMVTEAIIPASRYGSYSNDSRCIDDIGISRLRNAIVAKISVRDL
jgi:hypothetical protein